MKPFCLWANLDGVYFLTFWHWFSLKLLNFRIFQIRFWQKTNDKVTCTEYYMVFTQNDSKATLNWLMRNSMMYVVGCSDV